MEYRILGPLEVVRDGQRWDVISDAPMSTAFSIARFCICALASRDWVLFGNPIPGMLVADLSEDQRTRVRGVLDGMLRERALASGRAVLSNAVNIGIGTR